MGRRAAAAAARLLLLARLLPALLWAPCGGGARAPRGPQAAVAVACEPHRVVVAVHRDLFGAGRLVAPGELALGRPRCPPASVDAGANVVRFEAGLHECGSAVQMTPTLLIYRTSLFYTPSLASSPVILRTSAAEIPIECRYPRTDNVSSEALEPSWVPFQATAAAEARLSFSLRLMKEDWSAERTSTRFQLGEALRVQAELLGDVPLPLRLFVDHCAASLSPDASSGPQYAIVASSGCLVDGRQEGVSSTFLSPRPRPEALRFSIDAFRFAGDPRKVIYITCHLKAVPAEQAPDAGNKACSFDAERRTWLPVEGPRGVCSCCETGSCGGAVGEQPLGFGPAPGPRPPPEETSWLRGLPVEMADPQADLLLGPLFVFGSPDGAGGPSEDPADAGDPEMGTEGLSRRGPALLGEAEEGSGSGDEDHPATAGMRLLQEVLQSGPVAVTGGENTALELQAAILSRILEAPTATSTEEEAASTGTGEGAARQPGPALALLLPAAGLTVSVLAVGVFILMRRCRHRRRGSALPPPSLGTKL